MGKIRKLDACCKAACLIALAFGLISCTLPRILILHDPLTPEEHINLGVAYEKQGDLDGALKEYKAAAEGAPVAYLYMGNVYFQKGDFDQAERYYKRAIKKTGAPRAYNNLAWLYYTKGTNLQEAEGLAREALERAPDAEDFKDTLKRILERRALEKR